MESHLSLLKEMFAGKIYLSITDIAKLKNVSAGHIYNLISEAKKGNKELPFNLVMDKISGRPQVSILAMAKYMDSEFDKVTPNKEDDKVPVPHLVSKAIPKKRGRPRNSQRAIMAFQYQLAMAIVYQDVEDAFGLAQEEVDSVVYQDNEKSCSEKLDDCKLEFSKYMNKAKSTILGNVLYMQLSKHNTPVKDIGKI